jgi:hypothetical protein
MRASQRAIRDGKVVLDEIELGMARLRKKNLVGVADRDFLSGNRQDFSLVPFPLCLFPCQGVPTGLPSMS